MATQRVAGATDKVLAAALPGILKPIGMGVYNGHPTWSKVNGAGRKKPWEGESIQAAVVTSTYNKAASYQNDDTVDTNSVSPFTAVQFEMGGYQSSVNIPGMKIRKVASSPKKLFELLKTETRLAILDMVDLMTTHLLQTTNDSKGIYSLYTLSDATTTIAGLAGGSTWGGTTTTSGSFAAQGKSDLMTTYVTLSQYATFDESNNKSGFQNEPDLNVTTQAAWQYYWNALEPSIRYTTGGAGDVKLNMAFMGNPVVADAHCPSGVWYMVRSSDLNLYVHGDADFSVLPDLRESTQPDVWSRGIIWNGQLVVNSRRGLGKLISLAA